MKLRVSSAATTSSSAVIAICPATSTSRSVQRRPARVRRAHLAAQIGDQARAWSPAAPAPGRPAAPAIDVAASVNASTRPSMRRSKASGIGSGRLSEATTDVIHHASSSAADRAEQRQHHRFGDQLAHQAAAAGADREADADLLLPARRARQQHARDVGARDQQHQADDRHQRGRDRHHHRIERGMKVHVAGRLHRRCADRDWWPDCRPSRRAASTAHVGARLLDRRRPASAGRA